MRVLLRVYCPNPMLDPELFEGIKDLLRVLVSEAFRRTIQACETSMLAGAYCSLLETLHNFEEDTLMNWPEEGLFTDWTPKDRTHGAVHMHHVGPNYVGH